jgi:transcriptional regulator with XRE-family HTH domain
MNKVVGNKLKKLRQSKSLSQEQLADFLSISQSAYARMERGEGASWANHAKKICSFFKITPEELVKAEGGQGKEENNNLNEVFIINQLSDKIIEQYEARIKELKKIIKDLKRNRDV